MDEIRAFTLTNAGSGIKYPQSDFRIQNAICFPRCVSTLGLPKYQSPIPRLSGRYSNAPQLLQNTGFDIYSSFIMFGVSI